MESESGQRAAAAWGEGSGTVVAVVGLGHVKGIVEHWNEPVDLDDMRRISQVPTEPIGDRLARYSIYAIGALSVFGGGYMLFRGAKWAMATPILPPPQPTVAVASA